MNLEQVDAKEMDWFWRLAADTFNDVTVEEINYNLFKNDESYPDKLRSLDPFYRDGYTVTASKLKVEFRDILSLFMKVYSNFQNSGQGDNNN